jgi:hypothetical protein
VDWDEPVTWFTQYYPSLEDAERVIQNTDHIQWMWEPADETSQWVTISFRREPYIEDPMGTVVSVCEVSRVPLMSTEWVRHPVGQTTPGG